jgi:hypothetical protein
MATTTMGFNGVPEIGREYPPAGESEAIEKLRALHANIQKVQPPGPGERGQHPKQHGGVWATFTVEADIPEEMRVGIFAKACNYTALIRFSNGGSMDDSTPAVHAMAIKVLVPNNGASPHQQDFIVADHPVFFARDVQHMFEFVDGKAHGTLDPRKYPALAGFLKVATNDLLSTTYWSQTPYKLGSGAVKYLLRPVARADAPQIVLSASKDCLREALMEQLTYRKIGADFELCVNPQTDPQSMPIEDPTVEWTSPPVRLARISIYPQKFDSPEQIGYFANLSWSPWNALPEHVPLGGINRARKFVYDDSSALRHKTTGMAPAVPSGRESF